MLNNLKLFSIQITSKQVSKSSTWDKLGLQHSLCKGQRGERCGVSVATGNTFNQRVAVRVHCVIALPAHTPAQGRALRVWHATPRVAWPLFVVAPNCSKEGKVACLYYVLNAVSTYRKWAIKKIIRKSIHNCCWNRRATQKNCERAYVSSKAIRWWCKRSLDWTREDVINFINSLNPAPFSAVSFRWSQMQHLANKNIIIIYEA